MCFKGLGVGGVLVREQQETLLSVETFERLSAVEKCPGASSTVLTTHLLQKSGSGTTLSGRISRWNRDGLHARALPLEL